LPDECIHGLESGLCDLCYPKPAPVVEAPVATLSRNGSTRTATRTRPAAQRRTAGVGTPDHKVGEQRIYHFTHIDNLARIIEHDGLVASRQATPVVDASSADNREKRAERLLGTSTVADYVPFFLSPNAAVWSIIRSQKADPRLSAEIRHHAASEFVILVSTVKVAATMHVAVADGDPAKAPTSFGVTPEDNDRVLRKLRADDEAILIGEVLVHERFPFEQLALIGVANDRARDLVKEILQAAAHEPKVSVYPPWFAKAE